MTGHREAIITARLAVANRLADAARSAILPYFRSNRLVTENKDRDGFDPVTVADRAAEAAMRAILAADCPEDGVLGEELGSHEGTSGLTWVIDPIDGTRGFLSGTPTWGVLIALADASGPIFGLIDQPYTDERFFGGAGGAWLERVGRRQAIACAPRGGLEEAVLFTTFPEIGTAVEARAFRAVADKVRLVRYGMDCYAYALVAAGHVDLVIEAGLKPYDIQAPIAVIEAAGGVVTDWTGGPAHGGGRVLAAASAKLHQAALQCLARVIGDNAE